MQLPLQFSRQVLGLCLWWLLATPVLAAEQVEGLYDVAQPVASQSSQELARATREGLKTVLIRVSGNADVVRQQAIVTALGRASRYIRQYGYEYQPIPEEDSEQMVVFIEYEPRLVDDLLRAAGLPQWSSKRPSVLVWMVIEDSDGRRFVGRERDADIVKAINEQAVRRGLAIKLPELDLQDMVALSVDELWQLNERSVRPALERYQADTVLLGRVTRLTNGEWLGRWSFNDNLQQQVFDGEADSASDYLGLAIDQVAEQLAAQYAVSPVNIASGGVLMRIRGIGSFVDYARAIRYLESVAAIRHANVVHIDGDEIIVQLIADGRLTQLAQAFALEQRLQPAARGGELSEYPIDLDYEWPATESGRSRAVGNSAQQGVAP